MIQTLKLQLVDGALFDMLNGTMRAGGAVPAGKFHAPYLGLFTAWPGFSHGLQRSDLTEGTYTGYARQALVLDTPTVDADGRVATFGASVEFQPTDGVTPNVILGVCVFDLSAAGTLLGIALLPTPVTLGDASKKLEIVVTVAMPDDTQPDWGVGAAIN